MKRPLKRREAVLLKKDIKKTADITGYTVNEWMARPVWAAQNESGVLLGACLHDDIPQGWTEIAVVFVREEYRGQGIGQALLNASYQDILHRRRHILIIFREPHMARMVSQRDFAVFSKLSELPEPYKQYQFTLKVVYKLWWLSSFYRLAEIFRKRLVFGAQDSFHYGLKLCTDEVGVVKRNMEAPSLEGQPYA